MVAGIGALITEFSGLAGVGDLSIVPRWLSLGGPAALLLLVVWTGSYRRVERIALAVGLFELVFLWIAWRAHPALGAIAPGMTRIPLTQPGFLTLVAANIGAVVMPWMIFCQQSATGDKGLREKDQPEALWDTAIGAVISQIVMSAVLIATAATIGHGAGTRNGGGGHASLNTVGDVANAFTPALGPAAGRLVFAGGIVAVALVAAIVVSLALAWSFGDMVGRKNSLEDGPRDAPAFYAAFTLAVVAGAVAVQRPAPAPGAGPAGAAVRARAARTHPPARLVPRHGLRRDRAHPAGRPGRRARQRRPDLTPAARGPGSKARGAAPMLGSGDPAKGSPLDGFP